MRVSDSVFTYILITSNIPCLKQYISNVENKVKLNYEDFILDSPRVVAAVVVRTVVNSTLTVVVGAIVVLTVVGADVVVAGLYSYKEEVVLCFLHIVLEPLCVHDGSLSHPNCTLVMFLAVAPKLYKMDHGLSRNLAHGLIRKWSVTC